MTSADYGRIARSPRWGELWVDDQVGRTWLVWSVRGSVVQLAPWPFCRAHGRTVSLSFMAQHFGFSENQPNTEELPVKPPGRPPDSPTAS